MSRETILLGTRKGALAFQRNGQQWELADESFIGTHVTLYEYDSESGTLFAQIDDGHFGVKLQRAKGVLNRQNIFQDLQWEELSAPKYPAGSKLKNGNDAVNKYLWAFAAANGKLMIGTEPGGLFVSDDLGDSFQFIDSLWNHPSRTRDDPGWMGGGRDEPAIHSICVDPRNSDHVQIGISVAGVFGTKNGMKDWVPMNKGLRADFLPDKYPEIGHDPHLLVQCQSNPDVLWQQNHCGIFRSTDCGENWSDVSAPHVPANFGFVIHVDEVDGDTAWVVPAVADMNRVAVDRKLCVSRTTDGGKTWTALRNGLPQQNCYDFAFRHAMDKSGDQLVFGTACGSVYVSQDRGDNWSTIGNHFPPVYSVRIV